MEISNICRLHFKLKGIFDRSDSLLFYRRENSYDYDIPFYLREVYFFLFLFIINQLDTYSPIFTEQRQLTLQMNIRVGWISLFLEISKRLVLYVCKIVTKKSCQNFKALGMLNIFTCPKPSKCCNFILLKTYSRIDARFLVWKDFHYWSCFLIGSSYHVLM